MNTTKHLIAKWFLIIAVVFMTAETITPQKAQAQVVMDLLTEIWTGLSSVANIYQKVSAVYMELKETVLDPLAWLLGKQLLQAITADVVDWINSGFEGNPAFISNPTGFFLDVADQYTGAFIANSGPLSSLCSPFNLDIRANLGLRTPQVSSVRTRYTCTLDTIIKNAQNAHVSVGGSVSVNGSTIVGGSASANANGNTTSNGKSVDGFMRGDFSQGGWPAFIALTTEPQNNYMGAYLMARDDLNSQIVASRASINADVSIGGGFMSYKKCEDLGTVGPAGTAEDAQRISGNNPNATKKLNNDGSITYQLCHTETPGSTISASLNKQLGSGSDSLVAADEFDEILSAAFNQLLASVLKGGLSASSKSGSGGTPSIMGTLRTDTTGLPMSGISSNITKIVDEAIPDAEQYQSVRNATVDVITSSGVEALANSVYSKCEGNGYATQSQAVLAIIAQISNMKTTAQNLATDADMRVQQLYDMRSAIDAAVNDPQELSRLSTEYAAQLTPSKMITQIDVKNATDDQGTLTTQVQTLKTSLNTYDMMCSVSTGGGTTAP